MTTTKYLFDKSYFSEINTPDKAYWLGLLWADGCIHQRSDRRSTKSVVIQLHQQDIDVLQKLRVALSANNPIHTRGGVYKRLDFYGADLYDDLYKLGFRPRKSQMDCIPETLIVGFIRDFIRGVFDGDGCAYWHSARSQPCIEIAGNVGLCNFLKGYFGFGSVSRITNKRTWRWRASGRGLFQKFIDRIYYGDDLTSMDRKHNLCKELVCRTK